MSNQFNYKLPTRKIIYKILLYFKLSIPKKNSKQILKEQHKTEDKKHKVKEELKENVKLVKKVLKGKEHKLGGLLHKHHADRHDKDEIEGLKEKIDRMDEELLLADKLLKRSGSGPEHDVDTEDNSNN